MLIRFRIVAPKKLDEGKIDALRFATLISTFELFNNIHSISYTFPTSYANTLKRFACNWPAKKKKNIQGDDGATRNDHN